MYNIYLDKEEEFSCVLEVEGASLSNAESKLVLETTKGYNITFPGTVNSEGKCTVLIGKVKGLLEESEIGSLKLEVVVEDSRFIPWESSYKVKASKKVSIMESPENKKKMNSKPKVKVTLSEDKKYKEEVKSVKESKVSNSKIIPHLQNIMKIVGKLSESNQNMTLTQVLDAYSKESSITLSEYTQLKKVLLT